MWDNLLTVRISQLFFFFFLNPEYSRVPRLTSTTDCHQVMWPGMNSISHQFGTFKKCSPGLPGWLGLIWAAEKRSKDNEAGQHDIDHITQWVPIGQSNMVAMPNKPKAWKGLRVLYFLLSFLHILKPVSIAIKDNPPPPSSVSRPIQEFKWNKRKCNVNLGHMPMSIRRKLHLQANRKQLTAVRLG